MEEIMNWTLRQVSQREIDEEIKLRERYRNYDKNVCPLEVTFANGDKCKVWDLSEQKIFGLIMTMSNTFEKDGQRDPLREQWAAQIIGCWRQMHPYISAEFASRLFELKVEKSGAAKEAIRDFSGDMLNNRENMAREIAKYQTGGKEVSDLDVLQVLKNESAIEKNQQQMGE